MWWKSMAKLLIIIGIVTIILRLSRGQCPWHRDIIDLQTSCICAYNLGRELSVQCDQVNLSILMNAIDKYAQNKFIDLLYINNSTIGVLHDNIFNNIKLHNLQLSNCKISQIANDTFAGQEMVLKNLNLQDNLLDEIPIGAIQKLNALNLLDLSKNLLTFIPDGAFMNLTKLSTLKLNDNNITLSPKAFRGLEMTLKNLNLKATRQKEVPECIRGLKALAFLDLSLNNIKELPGPGGIRTFEGLDSLTALNLERNLIQNVGETSFNGVRKTLSSLSLLNNLLSEFPVGGIHPLRELRVLDIGFNLLNTLPEVAFRGNPSITLMALDGNPLATVPQKAFLHLNSTLRGLSLGGRYLHCDCKLRWVAEWIRNGDLQVTSRERNPQFCGSPSQFRDRGFYSIQPDELKCFDDDATNIDKPIKSHRKTTTTTTHTLVDSISIHPTDPTTPRFNANKSTRMYTKTSSTFFGSTHITTTTPKNSVNNIQRIQSTLPTNNSSIIPSDITIPLNNDNLKTNVRSNTNPRKMPPLRENSSTILNGGDKLNENIITHQERTLLAYPSHKIVRPDDLNEVQVKNAYRQDNSVIIHWTTDTANILGFRVVYRLFGEKSFKQGPPLEASEREFKIKNVPYQECIIVCVISLEELHVTPETIPYQQCREVRTVSSQTSNMDKITIAASAAICGTIIVAVVVFIAASRRSRKLQASQQKSPLPIGGLPVNCFAPSNSPGALGSGATLSAFNTHKDWDQVSAYSGRSIPRPRVCSIDSPDTRQSQYAGGIGSKTPKPRTTTDGQSQHSYTNNSYRGYLGSAFPSNLVSSRPELQQSHQSLVAASDRMSRASYAGSVHCTPSVRSSVRRPYPRSRSRDQLHTTSTHLPQHSQRPGSRYSTAGSTHTLNNYCDTFDNWTDHDMDIYMARNQTTRNGLVPL